MREVTPAGVSLFHWGWITWREKKTNPRLQTQYMTAPWTPVTRQLKVNFRRCDVHNIMSALFISTARSLQSVSSETVPQQLMYKLQLTGVGGWAKIGTLLEVIFHSISNFVLLCHSEEANKQSFFASFDSSPAAFRGGGNISIFRCIMMQTWKIQHLFSKGWMWCGGSIKVELTCEAQAARRESTAHMLELSCDSTFASL